ncbi:MAG: T9SS type A sorting domain-containing protein [candidate division WOR-3 bacterium]|nr:MAG: T9SS type A sorting domain-containing protein [candidate division WOR-3 bacterium]
MKATMSLTFCLVLCATALGQSWQNGPSSPFRFCRFDGEYFPTTNRVYFLGGRLPTGTTSGRVWSYKPDSGTYHDMGVDMLKPVSNYDICLVQDDYDLANGDTFGMYIVGGRYDQAPNITDTVQVYYPVTNTVRKLDTDLFPGRAGGQITVAQSAIVHENVMYVTGGFNNSNWFTSGETWMFDPMGGSGARWMQLEDLVLARAYPILAIVDSFLFACGGDTVVGVSDLDACAECQRFKLTDPAAGWSLVSPMPGVCGETRGFGFDSDSPFELAGKIVVAGRGVWPDESTHCYIYDVAEDSWSSFPSLDTARRNHAGVFIPPEAGGTGVPGMWVFGGRHDSDAHCLQGSEYYMLQLVGKEERGRREQVAGLLVAPNPSRGLVTARFPAGGGQASLTVYDVLGTPVWTGSSRAGAMEIRGLAVGIYVLRLDQQGRFAERKLVVTR